MAQSHRLPKQASDNLGRTLTSVAEGPISRMPVPNDGKWHRVPQASLAVRLHVFPSRKGVLYTTSKASAVMDGDPVSPDTIAASLPIAADRVFVLTFTDPSEVFLAADPDGIGSDPIVGVMQSTGA